MRTAIQAIAALTLAAALVGGAFAQGDDGARDAPPTSNREGAPQTAAPQSISAGDVLQSTYLGRVSPATIQGQARPLFGGYGGPLVENEVDVYLILFATTDLDGTLTAITAQVFLPVLKEGEEPVALYAFGSGTTGVGSECAPSKEAAYEARYGHSIGYYRAYMQAYAGRGFVAILPDYLGFDDPGRPQAYFHAVAEARVMLDAIRAAHEFLAEQAPGMPAPTHTFAGGYSQGGHAAFAAADLRPTYAPDVPLHGMIGFAPTTNVERLLREGPYYAPYIAVSYASTYGTDQFDPADVLHPRWLPTLAADTAVLCVDRAQTYYPYDADRIYDAAFAASLRADRLAQTHPDVKRVLDLNRTGLSGHGLPALIVQGGQDIIVRDPTQELFLAELCERGSDAQYVNYPQARHRHTRPAGFEDAVAWMKGIASGGAAPSSCSLVLSEQLP